LLKFWNVRTISAIANQLTDIQTTLFNCDSDVSHVVKIKGVIFLVFYPCVIIDYWWQEKRRMERVQPQQQPAIPPPAAVVALPPPLEEDEEVDVEAADPPAPWDHQRTILQTQ
jgi:hypothetical protein